VDNLRLDADARGSFTIHILVGARGDVWPGKRGNRRSSGRAIGLRQRAIWLLSKSKQTCR
jgi:hypothetical protein